MKSGFNKFSRYGQASIVPDKSTRSIINAFYIVWDMPFRPPTKSILTDNGKDVDSDAMQEFRSKFNFVTKTTAPYR